MIRDDSDGKRYGHTDRIYDERSGGGSKSGGRSGRRKVSDLASKGRIGGHGCIRRTDRSCGDKVGDGDGCDRKKGERPRRDERVKGGPVSGGGGGDGEEESTDGDGGHGGSVNEEDASLSGGDGRTKDDPRCLTGGDDGEKVARIGGGTSRGGTRSDSELYDDGANSGDAGDGGDRRRGKDRQEIFSRWGEFGPKASYPTRRCGTSITASTMLTGTYRLDPLRKGYRAEEEKQKQDNLPLQHPPPPHLSHQENIHFLLSW